METLLSLQIAPFGMIRTGIRAAQERSRRPWKRERERRMTDWKTLEEAEDHAYFMAELIGISPESFTFEEKKQILDDMLA